MKRYAMDYYAESTLNGPACNVTMLETADGEWVRYEEAKRLRAENERLRAGLLAASKDLVDATYEDSAKGIKEFAHYALNKLGDAINPPNAKT